VSVVVGLLLSYPFLLVAFILIPARIGDAIVGSAVAIPLLAVPYLAPTLTAYKLKKVKRRDILWLNIFAGWTLIGWVIALVWALVDKDVEQIKRGMLQEEQRLEKMAESCKTDIDRQLFESECAKFITKYGCHPQVVQQTMREKVKVLTDEYRLTHKQELLGEIRQLNEAIAWKADK